MFGKIDLKSWPLFFLFVSFSSCFLPVSSFCEPPAIKQVCLKDRCLSVEIADTNIQRALGLQGRKELAEDAGMLFIFDAQDLYDFWMKDTLLSLDMIWIDQDRKVVDIKSHVPPCAGDPCAIYTPAGKAKYVLEINAGQSDVFKLHVGDELLFK